MKWFWNSEKESKDLSVHWRSSHSFNFVRNSGPNFRQFLEHVELVLQRLSEGLAKALQSQYQSTSFQIQIFDSSLWVNDFWMKSNQVTFLTDAKNASNDQMKASVFFFFQVSGGSLNETDLTILDPSYAQFSSVAELQAAEWVLPGCRYYKLNLLWQSKFLSVPVVYCSLKLSKIRSDLDERPLRKSGCWWHGNGYQTCKSRIFHPSWWFCIIP